MVWPEEERYDFWSPTGFTGQILMAGERSCHAGALSVPSERAWRLKEVEIEGERLLYYLHENRETALIHFSLF